MESKPEQHVMTAPCKKCGAVHKIDEMFADNGPCCAACKPEGAPTLNEWLKAHAKMLTTKEAYELANKGELKTLDISTVDVNAFMVQVARDFNIPVETVKLVGVGLYLATDDRKVMLTLKEFSGQVANLLFTLGEEQAQRDAVNKQIAMLMSAGMRQMMPQPCDGECSGCGDGCDQGASGTEAGEKRPEYENSYG